MTICKSEFDAMQEALIGYGAESTEYREARERYQVCMEKELMMGRESNAAAWDERLYLFHKQIQEAWERLFHGLKVPPKPTCGRRSLEIRSKILGNKRNAMIFSEKMEESFRESGVKLESGETYTCLICVVKKPEYASEAMAFDPLGQNVEGAPRFNYIMEPAVMNSLMNAIEQDRIDYGFKVKKK